jgi:uncharacterized protein YbaA (DUF1428 family)
LLAELEGVRAERDAYREVAETMHLRYAGHGRERAAKAVADMLPAARRFLAKRALKGADND